MLRMLNVGYCYGIRFERKLCEEVELHLAYRWFCCLALDDKVPHHSTFSVNRHGRFRDSDIVSLAGHIRKYVVVDKRHPCLIIGSILGHCPSYRSGCQGSDDSIEAMSGRLGMNKCRLTSLIRLSHLAPEIVGALLAGRHHAYALQDEGADTIDANGILGLPIDARTYETSVAIIEWFGLRSVRLLTNNLDKVEALVRRHIEVERIPLVVDVVPLARHYLATKKMRLGHDL